MKEKVAGQYQATPKTVVNLEMIAENVIITKLFNKRYRNIREHKTVF